MSLFRFGRRLALLALVSFAPISTDADAIVLRNIHGLEVRVIPYGGIITSIRVPDRSGRFDDIVLGYDTADEYMKNNAPYMGAVIGRYANRIANGIFTLDGRTYTLATNNGPNHLHGGKKGFDKVIWRASRFRSTSGESVTLRYVSPDGEEGYPGRVRAEVTYTLNDRDELSVEFTATTSKPTIVNLTVHPYFNLTGGSRDVLAHELTIDADRFTPVDATSIPTGELASVDGTPFDFLKPVAIGAHSDDDEQLRRARGYDHNFVLNRRKDGLVHAAHVYEPSTGRTLDLSTTEPGLQFYSGNFLDGSIKGKANRAYGRHAGFCLEPQHFPDSPNKPQFPSTVLRPGQEYRSRTVFTFSAR
jgi:aldose 1-epimerase